MKTNFLLILLPLCMQLPAQIKSYNLSDYKLPDIKRQTLESSIFLNSNNNNRKYHNNYNIYNFYQHDIENNFSTNLGLNYTRYVNNSAYQNQIYSNFSFGDRYNYTDRNLDSIKGSETDLGSSLYNSTINRWYFNRIFFEFDQGINYNYNRNNKNFTQRLITTHYTLNTHEIVAYLPLKTGVGRIEQVQDASQAIYILNELSKHNRISRAVTNEDVTEMAKFISLLKNKRFFDSRIRKIYEIEAIDSFLNTNNLISKSDARYFTTLNDYWDFGSQHIRNSGTRLSFCFNPAIYYNKSIYNGYGLNGYSKNYVLNYLVKTGIEITHEKPINLFWQNSIEFNAYYCKSFNKHSLNLPWDEMNNLKLDAIQFNLFHMLGFYPNTRTEMNFYYGLIYTRQLNNFKEEHIKDIKAKDLNTFANLSVNYYISQRLRLNFNANVTYRWDESDPNQINLFLASEKFNFDNEPLLLINSNINKSFSGSFELKLAYSIF